jgi:hypothetical protein
MLAAAMRPESPNPADRRARRAVGRLLDAVDRVLAAAAEVARARDALDRAVDRPPLQLAPEPPEGPSRAE